VKINITYQTLRKDGAITLGEEVHDNITELLIPSNKNVTITRYFLNEKSHRWLVTNVEYQKNSVLITLSERDVDGEIYLLQTMGTRKMSAPQLLRKGRVVEVEFGFKPDCYKGNDKLYTAKRYPDVNQQMELHKRRPAIVLKSTKRGIQVIPLTSQEPNDFATNNAVFKLEQNSLENCYSLKGKDSYALSNIIQTVSSSRILPPLTTSRSNKPFRDESYRVQLNKNDLRKLENALAHNVGYGDYYELKEAYKTEKNHTSDLIESKNKLEEFNQNFKGQIEQLENELSIFKAQSITARELLEDQYIRANLACKDTVKELIDKELMEFI